MSKSMRANGSSILSISLHATNMMKWPRRKLNDTSGSSKKTHSCMDGKYPQKFNYVTVCVDNIIYLLQYVLYASVFSIFNSISNYLVSSAFHVEIIKRGYCLVQCCGLGVDEDEGEKQRVTYKRVPAGFTRLQF